jgi:hypothetical protein
LGKFEQAIQRRIAMTKASKEFGAFFIYFYPYFPNMNRKRKKIQILLAFSFVLFLSVFSAYVYYNSYAETDLPSAKPAFDNPDQDYLLINQETKPLALGQNTFPFIFEAYLLCQLPLLSFGMPSVGRKPFVLRC